MEKLDCILIIDDDDINNFIFSKIIKSAGVAEKTEACMDGRIGLNYILQRLESGEKLPEVIFLDINMPNMDGWEFLDVYKKLPLEVRNQSSIYMLSSSVYEGDIKKSKTYEDVVDYFSKPLTKEMLVKVHENFLKLCYR